jgi:hypothetical protein
MFGLVAGSVAPLHGQSLADVAKKENERRQAVKAGTKVYTNGDLKTPESSSDPINAAAPPAGEASAAAEKKPADGKADEKGGGKSDAKADDKAAGKDAKADAKNDAKNSAKSDAKDQEYWSTRMRGLNESLERDRLYADAIQTRINSLTSDFSGRDDPAQRALIAEDREKAVAELSRLRKQIEEDKDAIGAAEEEARRSGVPPGWLR